MDDVRLLKIIRGNIPAGRRFLGRFKRRWSDLIFDLNRRNYLKHRRIRRKRACFWDGI
jgi:hypothetical protein